MEDDTEDDDFEDEEEEGVDLDCPTCREVQTHEVLRAAAAGWTVRCMECQTTRTLPAPPKERTIEVPVILSEGATARTVRLAIPLDGPVSPDDEFDLEGHRVRITAVELPNGERPKKALGRNVRTLYAVMFDTVPLDYTLNEGETTRSFREQVAPEEEVHVGTVREVQGVKLVVKTLKSDQNRTLHSGYLLARNVRRVFADVANPRARHGQRHRARKRGPPPGVRGKPKNRVKKPGPSRPRRS
ncbi:MAG: HVO_0476 family zinc finger protein [bacterium]